MNKREQNIEVLLEELTLEEKIGMIHGGGLFQTKGVERLGIPPLHMSDGPMGVRQDFETDEWKPVGLLDDQVSYLPSNSAIASTWNRELAYECGKVLGCEARGRGKDIILAPGVNIKRSPLCGRNFEYMSEDPYLTKEMAVPYIQGVQENDVAACVKHFALNNQETNRLWVDTKLDERTLREIYFPAFLAAIKEGNSYALMSAYNQIRGEHASQSKKLLDDILREEWSYDGCVVSDWGAVHDTEAAALSGLDIEMSVTNDFDQYHLANPLIEAVKPGHIKECEIDKKVRNILRMMDRIGIFSSGRSSGTYNAPEHQEIALKSAREAIVLLKNEDELLPLQIQSKKQILMIGDNAWRPHADGGGSAEIKAFYEISPLLGMKMECGGNVEISFAQGYYVEPKEETDSNWQETSLEQQENKAKAVDEPIIAKRQELREEAVRLAKEADQVIFVGGLNHDYDVEGWDRGDLELPYGQRELIQALLEIKPQMVVVILSGAPVSMEPWADQAKAIVWMSYSGMEGGRALAEILLGKVNPSGKLQETFPVHLEDCSAHSIGKFPGQESITYEEGMMVGYRYFDTAGIKPRFCFGHGLSYSRFEYQDLEITKLEDNRLAVRFMLTNAGEKAGKEVVQLYVKDLDEQIERPEQELKQFTKVNLLPGERKSVILWLDESAFNYYDVMDKRFKTACGNYEIRIGSTSRDIRLKEHIRI